MAFHSFAVLMIVAVTAASIADQFMKPSIKEEIIEQPAVVFSVDLEYMDQDGRPHVYVFQLYTDDSFEYELHRFCVNITCDKELFLELYETLANRISRTNVVDKIRIGTPLWEKKWRDDCRTNGKQYGAQITNAAALQLCFGDDALLDPAPQLTAAAAPSVSTAVDRLCGEKQLIQDEYALCPSLMQVHPDGVVYSFGVYNDPRFEFTLIDAGRQVYSFDPFPVAVQHMGALSERGELPDALHFMPVGVQESNGRYTIYTRRSSGAAINVTEDIDNDLNDESKDSSLVVPMMRFVSILTQLGHLNTTSISIVKMDIEGSEMAVLQDILNHDPYIFQQIDQICMELHWDFQYISRQLHETAMILDRVLQHLHQRGFRKYHEMPREDGSRKVVCLGNFSLLLSPQ